MRLVLYNGEILMVGECIWINGPDPYESIPPLRVEFAAIPVKCSWKQSTYFEPPRFIVEFMTFQSNKAINIEVQLEPLQCGPALFDSRRRFRFVLEEIV